MLRKKRLIEMVNYSANTLCDMKGGLIKYIKDNGGKWIDHGTDDNDRVCFCFRGRTVGISTHSWDIDCELVSFSKFIATIAQE